MSLTTPPARGSSRTGKSSNPDRRHRANFARQATIDAFGWRFARALDQADFLDRRPDQAPLHVDGRSARRAA